MESNDTYTTSLPWLLVILLAFVCLYLLATRPGVLEKLQAQVQSAPASETAALEMTLGEQIREGAVPPPALSEGLSESLESGSGFQALVSLTDAGFEPASLTVRAGDTVRFTNNSSESLRIRGTDASETADSDAACGPDSIDSCRALAPQEFWEHIFTEATTVHYGDESGMRTGVVIVE